MGGGGDNKVLACVSCIVCLITLGLLAGHSAVIISMIILADGDAAYEVSPTCDSRMLNHTQKLSARLPAYLLAFTEREFVLNNPGVNPPSRVAHEWRQAVDTMRELSILDLVTTSIFALTVLCGSAAFVYVARSGGSAGVQAAVGGIGTCVVACFGCVIFGLVVACVVKLIMFTKEVLDIKSECEGNEVYEEVLLYMRLAWVCVAGPFVFSCVAACLKICACCDWVCSEKEDDDSESDSETETETDTDDDEDESEEEEEGQTWPDAERTGFANRV